MRIWIVLLAVTLVLVLPGLLQSLYTHEEVILQSTESDEKLFSDTKTIIHVKCEDTVEEMELDTYVLCVLLGEVPAEFEEEALKAQAIATRTYTLRKMLQQNKHADAHLCTQSSCCQAFMEPSAYLASRGTQSDIEKINAAVLATSGQVITFEGNLIEATYFSCSGGMTEDAEAVWGTGVPYLQSVISPGEENTKYYEREVQFTREEFLSRLGLDQSITFSEKDIDIHHTSGGGVDQMTVCGIAFDGTQVRTLLNLPSTAFRISIINDSILITIRGYGHRVGMSQYGADAMAVSGYQFDEILKHYYPGAEIVTFTADQMNAVFDKAGNL